MIRNALVGLILPVVMIALAGSRVAGADSSSPRSPRERLLMDFGWRFQMGDPPEVGKSLDYPEESDLAKVRKADLANWAKLEAAQKVAAQPGLGDKLAIVQPSFDDAAWRKLDLPHDWVVELPFSEKANFQHGFKDIDPAKAGGGTNIGWYRRTFELPAADKGKALWIEFDGVYRNSLVWLNGHLLGRHPSGYTSFAYDIGRQANYGGKNTLVVRVDATRYEGWFYEGGGIYRHVWLLKTGAEHVAPWGTFVASEVTPDGETANITLKAHLTRRIPPDQASAGVIVGDTPGMVTVEADILDADGKKVASWNPHAYTSQDSTFEAEARLTIEKPHLWSLDSPYRYKIVTTIKEDMIVSDVVETPFGIRTIRFDVNKGVSLNGQHVEIKGTCNHQDHAGVGSALPDRLQYWRIERLKEMGCNAYRTSHNAPTPELLEACDKLGMLVLDESRRAGSDPEALGQLQSLIERDRNHPCVFAWSLCNEEFRDNIQGDEQLGTPIAKAMQDLAHKLDPTRLCTCAMNGAYGSGFATVIDVMGFNYPTRGKRPITVEEAHAKFPEKPCMGTEDASTRCTRGIYPEDARGNISSTFLAKGTVADPKLKEKGYVSAYDIEGTSTAEKWWNFYADRPFMSGSFVWTGFDYRGEPTPYKWPCTTSHFGIMDLCGNPKDNYYYYQAWWTDKPVLHVYPHWNWPGKEGKTIDVWVQSNCEEVELSLNGQSLGKQTMKRNSHLEWKVKYAPGTLLARGFRGGARIAEDKVETTGAPAAVVLKPDRATIHADGMDVSVLRVSVVDDQGREVPTAEDLISFNVSGPGKIIGVGNGDPSSHEADKASERHLFNGLAQVIVQSARDAGKIEVTATGAGLKSTTVTISAEAGASVPLLP